jgi:tetraacyldisaccharide 4'-kinase
VRRVDPLRDGPAAVGDEPLLLAGLAPTFAGADRAAAAKLAVEWGAQALVMDDGLQNPRLIKDLSLLVIDGAAGFGNRRLIPAGPLREPVAAAADRCDTAIIIGHDDHGVERSLGLRALHARLEAAEDLSGMRVLAFAGIGRPEKFFATCAAAGAEIAATRSFPDHHRFTARETEALLREAVRLGATPVTTPKDAVRLPAALRAQVRVIGVRLVWSDEAALETLLAPVLKPRR